MPVILAILTLFAALSGCAENNDNRNTVYEDTKAAFEKANLLSVNIGIFTKTESDGSVSYGECAINVRAEKDRSGYGYEHRKERTV